MKNILNILLTVGLLLFAFSCKKKDTTPDEPINTPTPISQTNNLIKLGETYINGASTKACIYSKKALETGYNEIYVSLFDSIDGSALSNGHFDITPMMDMGTMQHSSPVENTEDTVTTNGYFKSAVVFSMPGTSSQWSLNLSFHNHKNQKNGTGSLGVNVVASSPARLKSTVLALDSNYTVFISLIKPVNPQVGINDFEIVLHKKINGMLYVPIDNYTVEIEPVMPSMGHGSPNNINPTNSGLGHFSGKVNFTMSGLWNVKLKLYKNGNLLSSDQFFEMTI